MAQDALDALIAARAQDLTDTPLTDCPKLGIPFIAPLSGSRWNPVA